MEDKDDIVIYGQVGLCGHLRVFLGFAPARVLHRASFADVLNEDTGEGYQRPRSAAHSRSFKQYIMRPHTPTIPLTFNLRGKPGDHWWIENADDPRAVLTLRSGARCLAQVDCQHRLGELSDTDIDLAFMAFIGLDLRTEMALFNVINSKARGLASSLTDYHESNLLTDLPAEAPHLYIARKLNETPDSPWYRLIRYGGETSSGLKRRTSLRMMQKTIQRFLRRTRDINLGSVDDIYTLIADYWLAVRETFKQAWNDPRHHLLTKGVGLYSLMHLLADIVRQLNGSESGAAAFTPWLQRLRDKVNWDSKGMFADAGGQKGALKVYQVLRKAAGL